MKFNIGDKVALLDSEDSNNIGVVDDIDGGEVSVLWPGAMSSVWEESRFLKHTDPEIIKMINEKNKLVQDKIDKATQSLEEAFQALCDANAIESGHNNHYGAYALKYNDSLNLSLLEKAVRQLGWSTSSLYC